MSEPTFGPAAGRAFKQVLARLPDAEKVCAHLEECGVDCEELRKRLAHQRQQATIGLGIYESESPVTRRGGGQ